RRSRGRGEHPARPQGAVPEPEEREVPRLDPHAPAERRRPAGAAARGEHASVQAAGAARRLPARVQGQEDPHEGAAALRERRQVARREGAGRHREPRAERARHQLLPGRPAGVHRGRSLEPHGRPFAARAGGGAAEGRGARDPQEREPGGRDRGDPVAHHRGGGSRCRRCRSRPGRCADHRAGGRAEGRRGRACRRREGRERRQGQGRRSREARRGRQGREEREEITLEKSAVIRLIVGLGNPGKEYERTRHNAGFWLLERFASANGIALRKDPKFQALVGRHEATGAWLLEPQSFMNASGRAVQMLAGFFKIKPEEILVVHDELDFPPGVAKMKQGGGIAGHNGLKDISQRIASHDYWRLRIGVGKPPADAEGADYVLQRPPAEEKEAIDAAIQKALDLLPMMLAGDMQGAMNKLHTEDKPPAPAKKEPEKKEAPVKEPEKKEPEKKGLLSG